MKKQDQVKNLSVADYNFKHRETAAKLHIQPPEVVSRVEKLLKEQSESNSSSTEYAEDGIMTVFQSISALFPNAYDEDVGALASENEDPLINLCDELTPSLKSSLLSTPIELMHSQTPSKVPSSYPVRQSISPFVKHSCFYKTTPINVFYKPLVNTSIIISQKVEEEEIEVVFTDQELSDESIDPLQEFNHGISPGGLKKKQKMENLSGPRSVTDPIVTSHNLTSVNSPIRLTRDKLTDSEKFANSFKRMWSPIDCLLDDASGHAFFNSPPVPKSPTMNICSSRPILSNEWLIFDKPPRKSELILSLKDAGEECIDQIPYFSNGTPINQPIGLISILPEFDSSFIRNVQSHFTNVSNNSYVHHLFQ